MVEARTHLTDATRNAEYKRLNEGIQEWTREARERGALYQDEARLAGLTALERAKITAEREVELKLAREIDKNPELLVAVQPTRGLDVGAIEYIHKQLVAQRDEGKGVLLVSLELDEVMNVSDRILVMYEGEIVGEFDPKTTTVQELGLYMAGARKQGKENN